MSLEHDLIRLGRIIAADQGLEVEVRGSVACASPGKIIIPSLENVEHLGDDAERMLHGFLDHECGHALDSDFDVYTAAHEEDPALGHMLNALEDGYIERRVGLRYRGCQYNLARKNEWFWERKDAEGNTGRDRILSPEMHPWEKFSLALTMIVRPWGGREIDDFADDPELHARLLEVQPEIDEVAALEGTKRTKDVLRIARRVMAKIKKHIEPPEEPKADNPEAVIAVLLKVAIEGDSEGASEDEDEEADDDAPPRYISVQKGGRPYQVFSYDYDQEPDFSGDTKVSANFERLCESARDATEAFTQAFETALFARRAKRPTYDLDEGIIDPLSLVEYSVAARGTDTLWMDYLSEADAHEGVAVSVLVDCSGSMDGSRSRLAAIAATAIHRACLSTSIPHEVVGFTYCPQAGGGWARGKDQRWSLPSHVAERAARQLREAHASGQNLDAYARTIPDGGGYAHVQANQLAAPIYPIFKAFGTDDGRGIAHIKGVGANLDGEAVLWAARRLAARPERRRVLFVLSDGQPAGARCGFDEAGHLQESVRRVREAGIETYGIGIESRAVEHYYPTYWTVNRAEDLPAVAVGAVVQVLLYERDERSCVTL